MGLVKNQPDQGKTVTKQAKTKSGMSKTTVPDTTDYVNELIFKTGESPFNQRF